jgi:hypothetical protein
MSDKHVIYLMTQLTKLYVYHHECFNKDSHTRPAEKEVNQSPISSTPSFPGARGCSANLQNTTAWHDYLEAANQMVQVVCRSHIDHIRYGHPLLANTYWMVAAIQLLRKMFATSEDERELAQSNFDIMKLSLVRHQKFWNASSTPLSNLTALSLRLNPLAARINTSTEQGGETTNTMAMVGTVPTNLDSSYRSVVEQNTQEFTGNAVCSFPPVEDTWEFFSGNAMDNTELQACIDSIFSNQWNDWNDNMDLETLG